MKDTMHRIFGIKEDVEYIDREGVYFIPCRNNQVGVVHTPKGYFLLGGGLELKENYIECLERECLEEVGCFPRVEGKLFVEMQNWALEQLAEYMQ